MKRKIEKIEKKEKQFIRAIGSLSYLLTITVISLTTIMLYSTEIFARQPEKHAGLLTTAVDGAFRTSVKIEVPAFHGVEPEIALTYSSSSGNGKVGVGWNITGESTIERVSKGFGTPYYDFTFGNVFLLDGEEIIPITSVQYDYKTTKNKKITYNSTSNTWTVWEKNGTKSVYVFDVGIGDNIDQTRRWRMIFKVDTRGNRVDYIYLKNGNYSYLSEIRYNNNVIKFIYESRVDIISNATGYDFEKTDNRVKTISVKVGTQFARAYELQYTYSTGTTRSLLSKINKIGKPEFVDDDGIITGGSVLPILNIVWEPMATNATIYGDMTNSSSSYGTITNYKSIHQMDFNGDGKMDIVIGPSASGQWFLLTGKDGLIDNVSFGLEHGHGGLMDSGLITVWQINQTDDWPDAYGNFSDKLDLVRTGDVNGDGKDDIIIGPEEGTGNWYVMRSTGTSFIDDGSTWLPGGPYIEYLPEEPERTRIVDVNGDGKSDILLGPNSAGNFYVFRSEGDHFSDDHFWGTSSRLTENFIEDLEYNLVNHTLNNNIHFIHPDNNDLSEISIFNIDVNGDGKTDIVYGPEPETANWYVKLSTGTSFTSDQIWASSYGHTPFQSVFRIIRPFDFNGDGKIDILIGPSFVDGQFYVLQSTGSSFVDLGSVFNGNAFQGYSPNLIRPMDVNGDGKTDLVIGPDQLTGETSVLRSTGTSFILDTWFDDIDSYWTEHNSECIPPDSNWSDHPEKIIPMDFNGDGKMDLVYGPNELGKWFALSPEAGTSDKLRKVTDLMGGTTSVSYILSTNRPNYNNPPAIPIVEAITIEDGKGNKNKTMYSYFGGYFHWATRQFKGFNVVQVDTNSGAYGLNYYHLLNGSGPKLRASYLYNNHNKLESYFCEKFSDAKILCEQDPRNTDQRDYSDYLTIEKSTLDTRYEYVCDPESEVCKSIYSTYIYDNYGNRSIVNNFGDEIETKDDTITTYTYNYDTTKYIVELPKTAITTSAGNLLKQIINNYDTYGNLTRKYELATGTTTAITNYQYDSFGNIINITDPTGKITRLAYDSTNVYNTTRTVYPVLGQSLVYRNNYDILCGTPISIQDPNLLTTSIQYDSFCRKTQVVHPDNRRDTVSYVDFGNPNNQYIQSVMAAGSPNEVWKQEYLDGRGRTYLKLSSHTNGIVKQQYQYDDNDNLVQMSQPHFDYESPKNSVFEYDTIGRIIGKTHADGTRNDIQYGIDLSGECYGASCVQTYEIHRDELNIETKIKFDAFGRSVFVGLNENSSLNPRILYHRDSNGQITHALDPKDNETKMFYNYLGNRTEIIDPDRGTISYVHDSAGRIIRQLDAKGQNISLYYDGAGRIKEKRYPEGSVVYFYDEAGYFHSKGKLTRVVDNRTVPANVKRYYYQDSAGKISKITWTIDNVDYSIRYVYDSSGRIGQIIYPDGESVSLEYGAESLLTGLSGDEVYATNGIYDPAGRLVRLEYGNGMTTKNVYYDRGWLHTRQSEVSSGVVQSLEYNYYDNGQVESSNDLVYGLADFTIFYDSIGRLYFIEHSLGNNKFIYTDDGNIDIQEGIGVYSYSPTKPHAVVNAGSKYYNYDANGNIEKSSDRNYDYNSSNQPLSVCMGASCSEYTYDGQGARVKTYSKTTGITTISLDGLYEERSDGLVTKYYYMEKNLVARSRYNKYLPTLPTQVYWILSDRIGNLQQFVDKDGNVLLLQEHIAFGERFTDPGNKEQEKHGFIGEVQDDETALVYMAGRYYDPMIGRFVTPGNIINLGPKENNYAFGQNDPLNPSYQGIYDIYKEIVHVTVQEDSLTNPVLIENLPISTNQINNNGYNETIFSNSKASRLNRPSLPNPKPEYRNPKRNIFGDLVGDYNVHDPGTVKNGKRYYVGAGPGDAPWNEGSWLMGSIEDYLPMMDEYGAIHDGMVKDSGPLWCGFSNVIILPVVYGPMVISHVMYQIAKKGTELMHHFIQ